MYNILETLGGDSSHMTYFWRIVVVLCIIVLAFVVQVLCSRVLIPLVNRFTFKTKAQWDDILLSSRVVRAFCSILPPIILLFALPFALTGFPKMQSLLLRFCSVYIIIMITRFMCIAVNAVVLLLESHECQKTKSLKGISQTLQIVITIIGVIMGISTLIDKSPIMLITGLGAMATVLMLIFQDSIKGLVAGIQLSANDMMRVGDWISVPGCGADGVVLEVTLNTVKVQNWDNTITTIPPYQLVSGSFQNWRGMSESAGRRICRSIYLDMHAVHFCSDAEVAQYRAEGLLMNVPEGTPVTNVQAFREYILLYLKGHAEVNTDLTTMFRQMQPSPEGMPIQLYCFSRNKQWEATEDLMARLTEYALASLPKFGLYVFQRSAGTDSLTIER